MVYYYHGPGLARNWRIRDSQTTGIAHHAVHPVRLRTFPQAVASTLFTPGIYQRAYGRVSFLRPNGRIIFVYQPLRDAWILRADRHGSEPLTAIKKSQARLQPPW